MCPTLQPLSESDLDRLVADTFIASIEYHASLPSTNDRALQLCGAEVQPLPKLVLAEEQTAGRGRGTNTWWSSAGALTFSVLLDSSTLQIPPALWPQVSLAAGLAVCDACDRLLGRSALELKWPNDVLAEGRKLSGILAESSSQGRNLLAIGMGVNVNNPISDAPAELQSIAASMCDLAGRRLAQLDVLISILDHLAEKLRWIVEQPDQLQSQWRRRCVLAGRTVHLELPDRSLSGRCHGIDDDGALLLETPSGVERYLSGIVAKWT